MDANAIIQKLEQENRNTGYIIDARSRNNIPFGAYVEEYEMVKTIIESLKKQIPMKPIVDVEIDEWFRCPTCKYEYLDGYQFGYCQHCGQKFEW